MKKRRPVRPIACHEEGESPRRRTPRLSAFVAVLMVLLTIPVPTESSDAEIPPIPEVLDSRVAEGGPAWVSADVFVDEAGEVSPLSIAEMESRGFHAGFLRDILSDARDTTSRCVKHGPIIHGGPPGIVYPTSVAEAADTAKAVLSGTVVGAAGGFFYGEPGLLIQVRVDERLKTSAYDWNGPFVYFYHPVGEFWLGSIRVCKTDPRWPAPPQPEAKVLLLPHRVAFDLDGVLVGTLNDPLEIVFDTEEGLFGGGWVGESDSLGMLTNRLRAHSDALGRTR